MGDRSELDLAEPVETQCPSCGDWQEDLDRFGVQQCTSCGWCAHPSYTGGRCDACGDREVVDVETGGRL